MISQEEILYEIIFESILDLITNNNVFKLEIETIVTDEEKALKIIINKYFPFSKRITCYYHYKENIIRNIRSYGLYKTEDQPKSDKVTKILSSIPFIYNGNITLINLILDKLKNIFKD